MWITDGIPKEPKIVLVRVDSKVRPIVEGYNIGERWRKANGTPILGNILGWMHIEDAVKILDAK